MPTFQLEDLFELEELASKVPLLLVSTSLQPESQRRQDACHGQIQPQLNGWRVVEASIELTRTAATAREETYLFLYGEPFKIDEAETCELKKLAIDGILSKEQIKTGGYQ